MDKKIQTNYDWFIYSTGNVDLPAAAGSVGTSTLQIAADAPFQVQFLTLTQTFGNAVNNSLDGFVNIEFSQQGRTLSNIAIPMNVITQNYYQKYDFEPYRLIAANSSIIVTFTNGGAGVAWSVNLCLHGNKLRMGTT